MAIDRNEATVKLLNTPKSCYARTFSEIAKLAVLSDRPCSHENPAKTTDSDLHGVWDLMAITT
jgi:hypothetical protein